MPVLHIGDIEIVARIEQLTSPSLHIKNAAGEIYHVAMMPLGGGVLDATETLVYQEDTINTCQTITLPAGIYRAELRGGNGGKPYRCYTGSGQTVFQGDIVSSVFKLSNETTLYSLRGGDGNDSAFINEHQMPGGGASGVDSILVIGNRTIRANGGAGTKCYVNRISGIDQSGGISATNNTSRRSCYGGGGGISPKESTNDAGNAQCLTNRFCCSGGGGGASNSTPGIGGTRVSYATVQTNPGNDATDTHGGNGGDTENLSESTNNNATGGTGGQNVYYSCGGQTAVSYGGGGGGAICLMASTTTCTSATGWCTSRCLDGGDGGTGSTNQSESSYLKIYKIG